MAVLLAKYLRYDFDEPDDPRNDHLIFSKGHASPLLYAMFKAAGAITDEELLTFRQLGSRLRGPPDAGDPVGRRRDRLARPGPADRGRHRARRASGSTGCPTASGCLCGDSEMAEGSMWEAFEHAGLLRARQPDRDHRREPARPARRDDARLGPRRVRRAAPRAFGWHAIEIDGHDVEAIDARLRARRVARAGPADGDRRPDGQGQGRRGGRGQGRAGTARRSTTRRRRSRSSAASATSSSSVAKPEGGEPHAFEATGRSSCRRYERRRARSRPARPTATRWPRSARRAATSSRSTARSPTRPTPRSSARRTRTASSRCTSPSSRWSPPRSACRCAAGCRSRRPSPPSSRAPTTSSAWPRSAGRTSASAARTPASRSARTARRRWRSRTSR